MPGVTVEMIGFEHIAMVVPPKYSIADMMKTPKHQSASHMEKAFDWLKKV